MPVNATIRLDSGVFFDSSLFPIGYDYWDVGYFQCDANCPDIRIFVDGVEVDSPAVFKLGTGTNLEIMHLDTNGIMKEGVDNSGLTADVKLSRSELYDGTAYPENRGAFDTVIRFHSGRVRGSMIKKRTFKQYVPGDLSGQIPPTKDLGPIAHDVVMQYQLGDSEVLKLVSGGVDIWRSDQTSATTDIYLEILGDNSTALKFYCGPLPTGLSYYWVPNQGDPPPTWQP